MQEALQGSPSQKLYQQPQLLPSQPLLGLNRQADMSQQVTSRVCVVALPIKAASQRCCAVHPTSSQTGSPPGTALQCEWQRPSESWLLAMSPCHGLPTSSPRRPAWSCSRAVPIACWHLLSHPAAGTYGHVYSTSGAAAEVKPSHRTAASSRASCHALAFMGAPPSQEGWHRQCPP